MPAIDAIVDELRAAAQAHVDEYMRGFEGRLASAMQKALDTVTDDLTDRLRALEEDVAKILRHMGLDKRG